MLTNNDFAVRVIAQGSFTDPGDNSGVPYLVNVWMVQLNPAMMKAWRDALIMNDRECYETDEEWEQYLTKQENRQTAIKEAIVDMLGIDADPICVDWLVSEIFTVVHTQQLIQFRVDWDDREGNRQSETFRRREDAEQEAARLRETFDYVQVVLVVEGGVTW